MIGINDFTLSEFLSRDFLCNSDTTGEEQFLAFAYTGGTKWHFHPLVVCSFLVDLSRAFLLGVSLRQTEGPSIVRFFGLGN